MESISLDKYTKLITKNWKLIAYFMAGMFVLAILYGISFYTPKYESNAKVLVKENIPTTFVIDLQQNSQFNSTNPNKNPILTQMEIFSSVDMTENIWKKLKSDTSFKQYKEEQIFGSLKNCISLNNPPGTDIIEVSVKWHRPDEAKKIAQAYLDSYFEYNVSVNKKSIAQMKDYIAQQLETSSDKLNNLRDEIEEYRKSNNSIDIDKETSSIIEQKTAIENSISEVDGQLYSEKGRSSSLSKKLGFDVNKAINSVAIGQNTNLITLQQNLHEAQQKHAAMNAKYPPTNPQMKALVANIKEIKLQIELQAVAIIGNKNIKKNSIISDTVRTDIVNELVKSQSNLQALEQQKQSLDKNLKLLNERQNTIPKKQKALESLLQNEKTLTAIVDTLNAKFVEAKIRESEIVSNINIIDKPSLPVSPSFPTLLHIIVLFEFIGFLLGVTAILGLYYLEDLCQGASEIEEILKAPVLGVIPWMTSSSYNNMVTNYNSSSIVNIVYQKIISSMKIKCFKKKIKLIGITSAEFEKKRPVISANIAKSLARYGNSVLIIDSDFRDGSIGSEFGIDSSNYPDLTDLITGIIECISSNRNDKIEGLIDRFIIRVPDQSKLTFIPNNNKLDDPYEVLTSEAFPLLLNYLKNKFDFIIIDTPPILAVPDSITISQYLDSMIVLCGVKTSRSNLKRINKLFTDNYVELLGAIARDSVSELDLPENKYIKNLSTDDTDEILDDSEINPEPNAG